MEELESELSELESSAMALSKSCVQEDSDTIQQMLQQLRLSVYWYCKVAIFSVFKFDKDSG